MPGNVLKILQMIIVVCSVAIIGKSCFATEKDALWEKRSNAQIDWQQNVADLLLDEAPEAKAIILIQRDLQMNYIKTRSEKYYFLLKNYPSRLKRNQGHSQWANFEWTEEDENELLKFNDTYKSLKEEQQLLKNKSTGHALWPQLRASFKTIQNRDHYQKLQNTLTDTFREIDRELNK